jgi:predicted metal-dependent phosphoesterase TrpH
MVLTAMSAPLFDLQSHSVHSDGALAPAAVIEHAAHAGIRLVALSDHDTLAGTDEALAAGAEHGIDVVPATEITVVDPIREDLHMLGYRVDHRDAALLALLAASRADRDARAARMAASLRDLGWVLDEGSLRERSARGKPTGRPHLATAALDEPANAQRLATEGIGDVGAFIVAYLIPGAPAFAARTVPAVAEAIDAIHAAGGVAVWAHPFWDLEDPDLVVATVRRFAASGLDGVEAFYVTHTAEQTALLADLCGELGLLSTGSADFHGPAHRLWSTSCAPAPAPPPRCPASRSRARPAPPSCDPTPRTPRTPTRGSWRSPPPATRRSPSRSCSSEPASAGRPPPRSPGRC